MSEPSPAEAIFFAALERATAAERAAFLDEACAGDEGLRRRVERLLAFNPERRGLVAVKEATNATLHLWDVESKAGRRLTGHTAHSPGLSFHPGGKLVATGSWDGTVRLWGATPLTPNPSPYWGRFEVRV